MDRGVTAAGSMGLAALFCAALLVAAAPVASASASIEERLGGRALRAAPKGDAHGGAAPTTSASAGQRQAYATLLYGDAFLLGVRVLGQSLRETGTDRCVPQTQKTECSRSTGVHARRSAERSCCPPSHPAGTWWCWSPRMSATAQS